MDPKLIEQLVNNHRSFLRFLEKRVENKAVAEEILQSAFVKSIEKGSELKEGEKAVAWFYRLLRNAIIDHYRKHGTEKRFLGEVAINPSSVEPDLEMEEAICKCMYELLPTMKPEYAELVRLVDLEDKTVEQVSKQIGLTSNNTAVKLHRARQALKKQLETSCGTCATHGCLDCGCEGPKRAHNHD